VLLSNFLRVNIKTLGLLLNHFTLVLIGNNQIIESLNLCHTPESFFNDLMS
jgi:hypothetical protein